MSNKLQIPKAIQDAVRNALASYPVAANTGHAAEIACEVFARALAEHPIVPTMAQIEAIRCTGHPCILDGAWYALEWQRRMFVAPEPTGVDASTGKIIAEARQRAFDEIMACARNEGIESGIGVDAEQVWSLSLQAQEKRRVTEPEVSRLPESVFRTLYARGTVDGPGCTCVTVEDAVKAAQEAYRRGKESREP